MVFSKTRQFDFDFADGYSYHYVFGIYGEVLSFACGERVMGEELKNYCLQLITDVPHEVHVAMLIVLCVGALLLIGFYGFREGLFYSLRLLFVEYVFLLYASTVIFRSVMSYREYEFTPFWSYKAIMEGREPQLLPENIMNVAVFVPVGLFAGMVFRRMTWKKIMIVGLCLSLGIELLQFVFRKGFAEVDDVMHNTVGCVLGYILFKGLQVMALRRAK